MKINSKIIIVSVILGLLLWIFDAVLDFLFFYEGTMLELLITDVPTHEIYIRLLVISFFIIFGIIISWIFTKSRQAEEELKTLSSMVEQSTEGMALADLNGNIMFSNKAWCKMHGYKSSKKLLGMSLSVFHNKEQLENDVIPFNEKVKKYGTFSGEVGHITKDGKPFPTLMTSTLLRDEKGNLIALAGIAKDITRYKNAEAALKIEKEFSENLLESANIIILTLDKNANITTFNKFSEKITDYTKEEVLGKNWFDLFIPKRERSKIPKVFSKVLRRMPEVSSFENPILCKNGLEKLISWENTLLKNDKGEICGILSIGTDITDRKQAEEALKESEEKLRLMINNSPIGFSATDLKGNLIEVNPAICNMIGYSSEEMIHKHFDQFSHPDDIKQNDELYKKLVENKISYFDLEKRYLHKNGNIVNVFIRSQIVRNDKGEPLFEMAITEDITKRKLTEEKLFIKDFAFNSTLSADSIGNNEGFITHVNPAFARIWGYDSMDEVIGKPILDFIADKDEALKIIEFINETGKWIGEYTAIRKNGSTFLAGSSANPIYNTKGKQIGLYSSVTDITKRKQSENKIKHLNLVLRALRNVNQLITKEKDRNRLIKKICKNLIEIRGYYNAWIVLIDDSGKYITSTEAGLAKDFLPLIKQMKKGRITTCGQKALKISDIVITEKPQEECKDCPLSGKYENRGGMTVRLEHDGKIYGLVVVSIPEELIEVEEEHSLFKEIAGDIAFALYRIEIEKEQKISEEQIKNDLKEKSILLQELYHRTKNNMQVVSSMLKIQLRNIDNRVLSGSEGIEYMHDSFNEIINKIKAMSLVHEKLYQAKDLSHINLKEYIEDLVRYLMRGYSIRTENVILNMELDDVFVLIDSAIPLGLVLNEIVSNVFKHAFPHTKNDELFIKLYKEEDETINLQLIDNGVGIPDDFDLKNVNTMGMQTVFSLTEHQLMGEVKYDTKNGLKWHIIFKDNQHKERV